MQLPAPTGGGIAVTTTQKATITADHIHETDETGDHT